MRRRVDFANVTINATQLVVIIGFIWGAAMAYRDLIDRVAMAEQRQIQLQSQLGEMNARLAGMAH